MDPLMMLVSRETRDSQFSTFCPPWRMMQEKALAQWHRSEGKGQRMKETQYQKETVNNQTIGMEFECQY